MTQKTTPRYLYGSTFADFIASDPYSILGMLHDAYHGQAQTTTDEAWKGEICLLQEVLEPWMHEEAEIIFEYDIPRLGKRIDVVLLLRCMIFCLEFKVGEKNALQADVEQVMDYALDLKNFHQLSHDRKIVPILIPTGYSAQGHTFQPSAYEDSVYNPLIVGADGIQSLLQGIIDHAGAKTPGSIPNWAISPYTPTPTIIEAARRLYENHSVEDITRHEADDVDTDKTISYILDIISKSKNDGEKSICFVTGVPGAGKTLVGLDVAVKQTYKDDGKDKDKDKDDDKDDDKKNEEDGAVYLSGNGPLVAVLTEALARDNYKKCRERGESKNMSDSRREVGKFIQVIHRYRDNMLAKIKIPIENGRLEIDPTKAIRQEKSGYAEVEHVAIFDEAQRSWTHSRIANYLKRGGTYGNKMKVPDFPMSEAAFLIWSLDQRQDWATIVCLVGGGQEINTGEAGIGEWINALNTLFPSWKIYISDKLTEPEYAEGRVEELLKDNKNVVYAANLHLGVSLRSFRSEKMSAFVHSLLSFAPNAGDLYKEVTDRGYSIYLTRDMDTARAWLRRQARGSQQTGVLLTKEAARFKPLAVNVLAQGDESTVHWFLEDKMDVRSSNYLEDAATEIQVQGLELDYACILWDADMRYSDGAWTYWNFNGHTAWRPERNIERQHYMLNAYRVLLTRARQGIVICVPYGNDKKTAEGFDEDPTRLPDFYDPTYKYLKSIGVKELTGV